MLAFAGCSSQSKSREIAPTNGTATITEEHDTTGEYATSEDHQTTETTTTLGPAEVEYDFGETHEHEHWRITVTNFELMTTFQTDDGGTYDMPNGEKLGIVTVEVTNQSSEEEVWAGMPFAVIVHGNGYEDKQGFKHPKFTGYVVMDDLKSIEHGYQYSPDGYSVDAGETVTFRALFVLPADITRGELSVSFDGESSDGTTYPARWMLN